MITSPSMVQMGTSGDIIPGFDHDDDNHNLLVGAGSCSLSNILPKLLEV